MTRKTDPERAKRIVAAYKHGLSTRSIAESFGISVSAVNRVIHENAPEIIRKAGGRGYE